MSLFPCVHHVEVGVTDGPRAVNILRKNFTFNVVASRNSQVARQWLLVKSDTRYLVTCLKTEHKEDIQKDDYVIDWMDSLAGDAKTKPRKDSVFNVCLQVDDLDRSMERLEECGVHPYTNIKTISDSFGSVRICTIKSCVGDVYHTLVEKKNYKGLFLPGFKYTECFCDFVTTGRPETEQGESNSNVCNMCIGNICENGQNGQSGISDKHPCDNMEAMITGDGSGSDDSTSPQNEDGSHPPWTIFDHVAFAVEIGKSPEVIDWYEKCFGMKRFLINSEDDGDEGLVLSTKSVNLRLRAMEYWKCSETGLATPKENVSGNRLSVVIAEGLPPVPGILEESQIDLWMKQHGGPGIQHIALSTGDIKGAVGKLKSSGVKFANQPPPAYYTEAGRLYDILRMGEDVEKLRVHGILIDTEADGIHDENEAGDDGGKDNLRERYLLQIFTSPIFPKDPFFMEIIQREGATGFGSGNVAALYRSVQACIIGKGLEMEA